MVVWSGGGLDYATTWNSRLFPRAGFSAAAKLPFSHLESDVLAVDDMAEAILAGDGLFLRCRLVTPIEFVHWAQSQ